MSPFTARYRQTTRITSAQVLALFTTAITVVPAPPTGFAVVPFLTGIYKPAGTAYAEVAAGEDLVLKYTNASGGQCSGAIETTGFVDQTTAQIRYVGMPGATGATAGQIIPVSAAAVVLHLLVGNVITGDSELIVQVDYGIVPMVLTLPAEVVSLPH